jgi:predicted PurR-regulated permease PerM
MPHHIRRTGLAGHIWAVLASYIRTQFILCVAVTLVVWGALSFLGVRHALPLGILTGSFSLVPVVGLTLAALIAALVAVFDGVQMLPGSNFILEGVIVIVVFGVVNAITDYILFPFFVGSSSRIHPVLILGSVIAATLVFGVVGTVLAVPALLVGRTVWYHTRNCSSDPDRVKRPRGMNQKKARVRSVS